MPSCVSCFVDIYVVCALLQVLVCEETGTLLLLEPLTVSTATLCLVSQLSGITLEKLLITQELEVSDDGDSVDASSDSLIERLVGRVPVHQEPGKVVEMQKLE